LKQMLPQIDAAAATWGTPAAPLQQLSAPDMQPLAAH
jgi:hypothetical protein